MITPFAVSRRLASLALATAMGAVLYVGGPSGKEGAARAADGPVCAASAKIAAAVDPLAKGDVAAMSIAKKPASVGDLTFNDPAGQPVKLSAFRGKTVLLNLWATWCVPCRGEMPELDKLQAELGDFISLFIHLDYKFRVNKSYYKGYKSGFIGFLYCKKT